MRHLDRNRRADRFAPKEPVAPSTPVNPEVGFVHEANDCARIESDLYYIALIEVTEVVMNELHWTLPLFEFDLIWPRSDPFAGTTLHRYFGTSN